MSKGMVVEPTGEVHPVAELFPMMTEDELDDLAADIKANGLLHPIVLDENGVLIDGRNRMAACQRAEVKPAFTTLNGHEPSGFIMSANMARRDMMKGQKAMVFMLRREILPSQIWNKEAAINYGISEDYMSRASVVLKYASHLAPRVVAGAMTLNDAYDEARIAKEGKESEAAKEARLQAEFAQLQAQCPELAAKVQEGELTQAGAHPGRCHLLPWKVC